jgi:hypothetical protein
MSKTLLKENINKDKERESLQKGLRILARIIIREELKIHSRMGKQNNISSKKNLIPMSKIYSTKEVKQ